MTSSGQGCSQGKRSLAVDDHHGYPTGVEDQPRARCGTGLAEGTSVPTPRDIRGVLTGNEDQANGWSMLRTFAGLTARREPLLADRRYR